MPEMQEDAHRPDQEAHGERRETSAPPNTWTKPSSPNPTPSPSTRGNGSSTATTPTETGANPDSSFSLLDEAEAFALSSLNYPETQGFRKPDQRSILFTVEIFTSKHERYDPQDQSSIG